MLRALVKYVQSKILCKEYYVLTHFLFIVDPITVCYFISEAERFLLDNDIF